MTSLDIDPDPAILGEASLSGTSGTSIRQVE